MSEEKPKRRNFPPEPEDGGMGGQSLARVENAEMDDNYVPGPSEMPADYSPEVVAAVCQAIESGMPYRQAIRNMGVEGRFDRWRKAKSKYIDREIARAESRFIQKHLVRIDKAGEKSWQASAWMLERRFPSQFSIAGRGVKGKGADGGQVLIQIISGVPRPPLIAQERRRPHGETKQPVAEIEMEDAIQVELIDGGKADESS